MHVKEWSVRILIEEGDEHIRARAVLHAGERTALGGEGHAHRNPAYLSEVKVPEIGDEMAVGRALVDLGARLLDAAAQDAEGLARDHEPKPRR